MSLLVGSVVLGRTQLLVFDAVLLWRREQVLTQDVHQKSLKNCPTSGVSSPVSVPASNSLRFILCNAKPCAPGRKRLDLTRQERDQSYLHKA
jgi:hypothetical protein